MELQFRVYGKIARPVAEVFDAVYNPTKLSGYFTTGGASAPLVEGSTVTWDFADFPGAFPVQVRKVERDRLIELEWKAGAGDYTTRTRREFEPLEGGAPLVRISEGKWKENQQGLDASYGNCMGWTQMLCAMKLYVERGINLREYFF
jgi:uncharacterized protein YndB with AHSA1/START domain